MPDLYLVRKAVNNIAGLNIRKPGAEKVRGVVTPVNKKLQVF